LKLAEDHTSLVLFIVAGGCLCEDVTRIRTLQSQANIEAMLPKFIVNPTRQARQKRSFAKRE